MNISNISHKSLRKNSDVHTNHYIVTDSIEPQCPIEAGVYTKLKLSDKNVDVCLFEQILQQHDYSS